MTEIRDDYDELADRLSQLGATDEELAAFNEQWHDESDRGMTDDEKLALRGMNDVMLRGEIAKAREDAITDTFTEAEEDDLRTDDEKREAELDADDAAWELLANSVQGVMQLVSESPNPPELAARLARLELTTETPRTGLVKRLQLVVAQAIVGEPETRQDDAQSGTEQA